MVLRSRGIERTPEAIAGAYFEIERDALIHAFLTTKPKGKK